MMDKRGIYFFLYTLRLFLIVYLFNFFKKEVPLKAQLLGHQDAFRLGTFQPSIAHILDGGQEKLFHAIHRFFYGFH